MFGTENEVGEFWPFHIYSMKQAIEEGFILDVLKHYLSYETYFSWLRLLRMILSLMRKKAKGCSGSLWKNIPKLSERRPRSCSIIS